MRIKKMGAICLSVILIMTMFTSCKKDVENEPYTVKFNDVEYVGNFTGTMNKDLPVEKGVFTAGDKGDDDYAKYSGEWAEGLANGKGKLIGYTDKGVRYNYVGDFKNGKYDGQGKLVYDKKMAICDGRFKNGEFTPTFTQRVESIGTVPNNYEYELSDKEKKILKENTKIFLNNTKTNAVKNAKEFNLEKFKIEPDAYKVGFAKEENLRAFQVSTSDVYGKKMTYINAEDSNFNIYSFFIMGDSQGVMQDDYFDAYFLPIDYTSYESVKKDNIYTALGFAVTLEK